MGAVSKMFWGTLFLAGALTILRIASCSDNLSDEEAREKARQVFKRGTDITIGAAEGALDAITNEVKRLDGRYDITGGSDNTNKDEADIESTLKMLERHREELDNN